MKEKNSMGRKKDRKEIMERIRMISLLMSFIILLNGCSLPGREQEPLSFSGFAFDTVYTLTLYQGGSQELLNSCVAKCEEYEKVFSRTRSDSELYQVNQLEQYYLQVWQEKTGEEAIPELWDQLIGKKLSDADQQRLERALQNMLDRQSKRQDVPWSVLDDGTLEVEVSDSLYQLVEKGLEYADLSQGGFDISICPVSSLWDFSAEEPHAPETQDIQKALPFVDYQRITIEDRKLRFALPGMGLDLGGIAKGYIADALKEYLVSQGVTRGLVNLGGNIVCIGRKSEEQSFHIGIQQPFGEQNETAAAVSVDDVSVVSSGIYERYFMSEEGQLYHHILNPKTGYPYETEITGVTIVSEKSVDGDGLSTTSFLLGVEKGLELINKSQDVEAVFITKDGKFHYSDGFESLLFQE